MRYAICERSFLNNIYVSGLEDQFRKLDPSQNLILTPFDYESIMLYGELAFSKDGRSKTMVDKRGVHKLKEVFDKPGLTATDAENINKLYNC